MLHTFSHIQLRCPLQSLRDAYNFSTDSKTIFQEGLYLSSRGFWQELLKADQLDEKERKKLDLGYAKYWLRSSARCTPYGTFAGSAMVAVSDDPSMLTVDDPSRHKRSLRIDMNYLTEIAHALTDIPAIREKLRFFPNNSIYSTPDGFRYAEFAIAGDIRHYHLTSFEKTPYITAILTRASGGATLEELAGVLVETEAVTQEEATAFLLDCCQSQLLIAELEPAITGADPLQRLIACLEERTGPTALLGQLKEIQHQLAHPREGVPFYQHVEENLRNIGLNIAAPKNTIQTDLYLVTKSARINQQLLTTIAEQAGDLRALSRQVQNADLQDFKTKFFARYEYAEIPLSIALDADLGIGYAGVADESAGGGNSIDGLQVVVKGSVAHSAPDYIERFTLAKYHRWLENKKEGIGIREEELKAFHKHLENFRFPRSMHLMGSLLKQDGLLDADHFVFDLGGVAGPSGANLLGRFVHGDEALSPYVRDILRIEEDAAPDHIYAEIAHLPEARTGNILLRPVLRDYEIPYVGVSGTDKEHQLTVDDLFVAVHNDEVVLQSRKHNKRVIPRLTSAHNFTGRSLPVYKFLCDLQAQGLAFPAIWDWGELASQKHLPRVTYKNLILHKASWTIEEKDVAHLPATAAEWLPSFAAFRATLDIPARVVFQEGDNELLIDFTRAEGMELFLHYLQRNKTIRLKEFLFTEDNCVVTDPDGAPYTNEVVIPVYREITAGEIPKPKRRRPAIGESYTQRIFSPYSEWLYVKIYAGAKSIEHLLSTLLLAFVEKGLTDRLFERFFFLRYRDETGGHLRIRFYNSDREKQLPVYQKLLQLLEPLLENGSVDKLMLDTYKRELERYSPSLIEASEDLFHNDSLAVLRFVGLLDGVDGEKYRLLFAMRGIDELMSDFGLSPDQKASLIKERQTTFFKEFGGQPTLQKQLNERYRKDQRFIADHLDQRRDTENGIWEAARIFGIRSAMNGPVIRGMLAEWPEPDRIDRLTLLLASYIHLFMNRLFIAQQRKYELVVYHFLDKYYTSGLAIAKKEKAHALPAL